MTDFKVTDEAVEAGVDAAMGVSDDRLARHKVVRSIIEAALPVMFQVVYQLRNGSSDYWEDLDESVYLTLSGDNDEGVMEFRILYQIKEPK